MKNTLSAVTLALASALTLTMAGCAATDRANYSMGDYVDDATISARVKAKFAKDPDVSAMRLNVDTLNGEVQLSGFATSAEEKARAAEVARSVEHVKSVRNNIVVRAN